MKSDQKTRSTAFSISMNALSHNVAYMTFDELLELDQFIMSGIKKHYESLCAHLGE